MTELFNNLSRSTLASGITSGDLSLTVQSGDGNDLFPALGAGDNFRCVLFKKSTGDIEIINVTARSGDAFTITRAQESIGNIAATAFAFDAGDLIELRPTSAFYTSLASGASSTNIQHGTFLYRVDTGAADAYVVAMNPTATVIADGQEVRVKIGGANTNTGIAATLKLDGLAAAPITMEGGGNPPAGSIKAGYVHTFIYDGTSMILQNAGLALTSSGFNALGKQIKNVAAGTANTDVATIGGVEDFKNKTLTSPVINAPTLNAVTQINSLNYYSFIPLATPEVMVSTTATTSSAWTTVGYTTLTANNAKYAVIRVLSRVTHFASSVSAEVYIRKTGTTPTDPLVLANDIEQYLTSSAVIAARGMNTLLIPLDASSRFDWKSFSAPSGGNIFTDLHLIGYYK